MALDQALQSEGDLEIEADPEANIKAYVQLDVASSCLCCFAERSCFSSGVRVWFDKCQLSNVCLVSLFLTLGRSLFWVGFACWWIIFHCYVLDGDQNKRNSGIQNYKRSQSK